MRSGKPRNSITRPEATTMRSQGSVLHRIMKLTGVTDSSSPLCLTYQGATAAAIAAYLHMPNMHIW